MPVCVCVRGIFLAELLKKGYRILPFLMAANTVGFADSFYIQSMETA